MTTKSKPSPSFHKRKKKILTPQSRTTQVFFFNKKALQIQLNKLSTKIKMEKIAALSLFLLFHRLTKLCTHSRKDCSRTDCELAPSCYPVQDAVSHGGTKGHTVDHPLSWSSPSKDTDVSLKLLVCLNNELWAAQPQMFQNLLESIFTQTPAFVYNYVR